MKDLSVEHGQIQEMKDLIFASMVQDPKPSILASNSSQLE